MVYGDVAIAMMSSSSSTAAAVVDVIAFQSSAVTGWLELAEDVASRWPCCPSMGFDKVSVEATS